MPQMIDMTGQRFGHWVVIEPADKRDRRYFWRCRCDCGNEVVVSGQHLRRGDTNSCGHSHGHRRRGGTTYEYNTWCEMIRRCRDSNRPEYKYYGGRGISVCERWNSFENFFADMGPRPGGKKEYSIDRIDNDGNYTPSNCRWATHSQQAFNRRNLRSKMLTHKGETRSVAGWATHLGLRKGTISDRLRRGLSVEQALSPVRR